jgi:hypothetical protein
MDHDEVTEIVGRIATEVAKRDGMTDASFVMHVYGEVQREAPEVVEFLRHVRPLSDPYQSLKWFIPDDLGFTTS